MTSATPFQDGFAVRSGELLEGALLPLIGRLHQQILHHATTVSHFTRDLKTKVPVGSIHVRVTGLRVEHKSCMYKHSCSVDDFIKQGDMIVCAWEAMGCTTF